MAGESKHPGVVHYLIHSYDYPSLAERGWRRRARTRKSRMGAARLHMRPTSSRDLACGKSRSLRTAPQPRVKKRTSRSTSRDDWRRWAARARLLDVCVPAVRAGRQRAPSRRGGRTRDGAESGHRPACSYALASIPARMRWTHAWLEGVTADDRCWHSRLRVAVTSSMSSIGSDQ